MSLTSLDARLDGRVVATDLDRALQLLTEADQLRANAVALLGDLDGTGLAQWLGYVSLDRLVAHRSSRGNTAARDLMRVARHLARFEATAAAMLSGQISFAAAEVLARYARDLAEAYLLYEDQLLDAAASNEVDELERICRLWRARADSEANAADAERAFNRRGVWMQFGFDGAGQGRFSLDATGAEAVWAALQTSPDPVMQLPEPRNVAQRRADKLVDICTLSTEGDPDQGAAGTRATVEVVIDIETLAANSYTNGKSEAHPIDLDRMRAELAHGGPITGPGLDRLLCDASFRALITDGPRTILAYNRATPAIPPALRRVVRVRDRCCTFTGCDRPWWWCDLHHITPRNRGGPTAAENLTLLCRFHHGCVHDRGWQLTRAPNGTIQIRSP